MISLSKRGAHFSVSERGQVASPREVAGLAESNRLARELFGLAESNRLA